MLTLKDITDAQGRVVEPAWLARAEATHRELRQALPADYAARMAEVFANGARMSVAIGDEAVLGVAVWRIIENTYEGRRLYVDDLVTTASARSGGVGKALMAHLQETARGLGCNVIALDSGTQRTDAHRFYFREGFVIPSFNFRKALS